MSKFNEGDRVRLSIEGTNIRNEEWIGLDATVVLKGTVDADKTYIALDPGVKRPDLGLECPVFMWPTDALTLIEAERDEWQWVNDDHTEARRGRWGVYLFGGTNETWWLGHADFGDSLIRAEKSDAPSDNASERFDQVLNDFLTWKAAQEQPAEPTGLGAVVEVPEMEPTYPGEIARFVLTGESDHNQKPWSLEGDQNFRKAWASIIESGPVTVLSEGVTR